jgi:phenylacetic acid degradation operon negative regulatory protein
MPALTARAMLFDLFGDFATEGERSGAVPLGALVRLAHDLGFGEAATRAAANRMVQDGWLVAERHGRASVYNVSSRGYQLVDAGRQRIFAAASSAWDGSWCMIALSAPEARRELRDRLRKELAWLGFGSPSTGLYLAPRDRHAQVEQLAEQLGAGEYLQVYHAGVVRPVDVHQLVARAWSSLDAVNGRYAEFLSRFTREQVSTQAALDGGTLDDCAAFRIRFTLVNQFRGCLFGDPDLPEELLPPGWCGTAARRLFLDYHALVSPHALRYFDEIVALTPPPAQQRPGRAARA